MLEDEPKKLDEEIVEVCRLLAACGGREVKIKRLRLPIRMRAYWVLWREGEVCVLYGIPIAFV